MNLEKGKEKGQTFHLYSEAREVSITSSRLGDMFTSLIIFSLLDLHNEY
jgi:hypothetical protein